MKKLLLLLLLIPCSLSLKAQSWNWISMGVQADALNDHIVAADDSGNGYVVGECNPHLYIASLSKFNVNGTFKWQQNIVVDSPQFVQPTAVCTGNGFVYETGNYNGKGVIGPDTFYISGGSGYLVKYSSAGVFKWARVNQGINGGRAYTNSACTDKWGNVYITGNVSDSAIIGTDTITNHKNISSKSFVAKYDSMGNLKWVSAPKYSANFGSGTSIAADDKGGVYVAGFFNDTVIYGNDTLPGQGYRQLMFVVKYDTAGNTLWAKSSWGDCTSHAVSVAADGVGNAYAVASYEYGTKFIFGTDTVSTSPVSPNTALIKLNAGGDVKWMLRDSLADLWPMASVAADTSKDIYMLIDGNGSGDSAACAMGHKTFKLKLTVYVSAPVAIVKLDSNGNVYCGSIFTEGEDDGDGIACSRSGKYIYAGGDLYQRNYFGNDTINASGLEPIFIASWQPCDSVPLILNNPVMLQNKVTLYPNPNNGAFTLQIKSEQLKMNSVVEIYNMLGEKVYTASLELRSSPSGISEGGTSKTLISLSFGEGRGEAGIYMYRIVDENGKQTATGKFVVE